MLAAPVTRLKMAFKRPDAIYSSPCSSTMPSAPVAAAINAPHPPAAGEGLLHSLFGRKVVRVQNKAIKSGSDVSPLEAETMKFIASNTTVPVPKVFDVYKSEDGIVSITMEYIDGDNLEKIWKELSQEQKLAIAEQLRGFICQLRELKGDYIGSINGGQALDLRIQEIRGGPFTSEAEFNNFLLSGIFPRIPRIYRDIAQRSLQTDHDIVFTHADLAPRNIMVKDGCIVAIIDWECAGWYPEYWEYLKAFHNVDMASDWVEFVPHIFPRAYEKELISDRFFAPFSRHNY